MQSPLVLVVWGGADFMAVIDQIIGSIFWTVLISIVIAVSLAAVFSRSLIRPVMELAAYARYRRIFIRILWTWAGRTSLVI